MPGKIYLIPNSLGNSDPDTYLPAGLKRCITGLSFLVVENVRNARRFLKSVDHDVVIDDIRFFELNKHTDPSVVTSFLEPVLRGEDLGIISEAGMPGIADPGATLVRLAHEKGLKVVPLTGPSSIFLALSASGLNGQSFRFNGYLPIQTGEKTQAIRTLEKKALEQDETQIFIETPYRNNSMMEEVCKTCMPGTLLTVAADLTTPDEMVRTLPVSEWKKKKPNLHKRPAVFLIGKRG